MAPTRPPRHQIPPCASIPSRYHSRMPRTELFSRLRRSLRAADHLERAHTSFDEALEGWSRRKFLRAWAVAAAGAAIPWPRIAHAQDAARVLILGAGTARLTRAYRPQQSGGASIILDAA